MGAGPTTLEWARLRGRSKTGAAKGRSDGQKKENRFQIMMEGHFGSKMRNANKDMGSSYGKKVHGSSWSKKHDGVSPCSKNVDANKDEEGMKFVEQPNVHIGRHPRNDAAQDGLWAPKEVRIDREGLGPFRMEDSVPTRKRGRPRKIPSIDADRLRSVTGVCRCGTLMHANQGTHSVREYTEEFLETTKRCKPKSAEGWCQGIKAELREEIQGKLLDSRSGSGGRKGTYRWVVAISSFKEEMEVEEDLRKRSIMDERTSGECTEPCKCEILVQIVHRPRLVQEYTKEFLDMTEKCKSKPAERMTGKAMAAKAWLLNMLFMSQALNRKRIHRKVKIRRIIWNRQLEVSESLVMIRGRNALLHFCSKPEDWNSGRIPINRGRIGSLAFPYKYKPPPPLSLIRNSRAKLCRKIPETGSPSRRRSLSLSLSLPALPLLLFSLLTASLLSLSLSSPCAAANGGGGRVCDTENGWRLKRKVRKSLRVQEKGNDKEKGKVK
ncbi:hypothetical protein IGI04_024091 [Brassica rapa subsp. trilocularis]|uniref:Retrotransposon gag domain-containing protein n=1 Tax=Brassica rapa subsp. trilocularis TaxID=1813537 RepID=A0ABQ7M5P8_BRACM|nr:hypothetical protein IGI04_024091 [Brassica rapa subsp. trilocularis]